MSAEQIIRGVGLFVSVVGLLVTAPDAVELTAHRAAEWLRGVKRVVQRVVQRFLYRKGRVINVQVHSSAAAADAVSSAVSHVGYPEDADVDQRLAWLYRRGEAQAAQIHSLIERITQVDDRNLQAKEDLERQLLDEIDELQQNAERSERADAELNGAGLIVAAFGIALSGLSPELSQGPIALWLSISLVSIIVTAISCGRSYSTWRSKRRFARRTLPD